jgi:hypothetical protein
MCPSTIPGSTRSGADNAVIAGKQTHPYLWEECEDRADRRTRGSDGSASGPSDADCAIILFREFAPKDDCIRRFAELRRA